MHVKLYEDIARFGQISISYDYPVMVNERYLMSPSPIPAFDNPKMDMMPALQLFGAGREKRIYAIPPWTEVRSLDFDDHPFRPINAHAGLRAVRRDATPTRTRSSPTIAAAGCSSAPTPITCGTARRRPCRCRWPGGGGMTEQPLLSGARPVAVLRRHPGAGAMSTSNLARRDAGDRRRIRVRQDHVAECAVRPTAAPDAAWCGIAIRPAQLHDVHAMPAPALRTLHRSDWGFVHQDPRQQPAHERQRRRQCRRTADGAGRAALRRHPGAARWTGWRRWRSTPTGSTICRAHSPAACCNGCRSPARW